MEPLISPATSPNCHAVSRVIRHCCPLNERYRCTHINGNERVTPRDTMPRLGIADIGTAGGAL